MGLAEPDPAVNEQRVVGPAWLFGDRHGSCVGELVARASDKAVKSVVGIERQRRFAIDAAGSARGRLLQWKLTDTSRPVTACAAGGEGLLALALAEIELGGRPDRDLDDSVGQLPRRHFLEPDAVQSRMLDADDAGCAARRPARAVWRARRCRLPGGPPFDEPMSGPRAVCEASVRRPPSLGGV